MLLAQYAMANLFRLKPWAVRHSNATRRVKSTDLIDIKNKTIPISSSVIIESSQSSSSTPLNSRLLQVTLDSHVTKNNITEAEILWYTETVMNHTSLRCAETNTLLFQRMLRDSEIAKI